MGQPRAAGELLEGAGLALCTDADLSVEAGLPSPVVQQLTSCVVAPALPYRLWLSREEGSASHC